LEATPSLSTSRGFTVKQATRSSNAPAKPASTRRERSQRSRKPSRGTARSRVSPKKSLSQYFLKSDAVRDKILSSAGVEADDVVIEIGAGTGALTEGLARLASRVIAVEIDRLLAEGLRASAESTPNVSVFCGDILNLDLEDVAARYGRRDLVVVGNLPYHVTTRIILYLLERHSLLRRATIMVQREYAERLLASPGGRDYGAITLRTGYNAEVTKIIDVPATAFHPRPRVDSTVLALVFRSAPAVRVASEGFLFELIRGAFAQRRKMLVNSLSRLSGLEKEEVKRVCRSMEVDPGRRPETLSLEEFAGLADALRPST
jgi:16S rRNA (adenine1518-N6/adenine1519-N6)-dimethyltransferase